MKPKPRRDRLFSFPLLNRALLLMPYALSALLLAIGLWLFVRPLRMLAGGAGDSLMEMLKDSLFSDAPPSRSARRIRIVIIIGCIAVLLPACLPIAASLVPADSRRLTLIIGGVTLILTAAATLLVHLISGLSFGFGVSSSKPATLTGRLAPAFPFVSGIAAILTGAFGKA